MGLLFPYPLLGGAAWHPSLGAVAFFPLLFSGAAFLSLLWVGFPFSSVGWCCLASSFSGSWCFATPHDGLGVGVLGGWVGCWGVGVFGVGWLRGWEEFGVFSVWIGVGVFLKAGFLVWARITIKTTLKSDQLCDLYDSVNHLKVERLLL